jgi:hypothetical protein
MGPPGVHTSMTALPPWARGALPLDLLFANANLPLWDRRLALEGFGQFTVLAVVSIGGLQICGVVHHGANDVGSLFF